MPQILLPLQDPFLVAHAVGPFTFAISAGLRPTSMRDQMIRGFMCVDRAIKSGMVYPGTGQRIVVIGGGVAGVTAALTAANNGIVTTLIDANGDPLSVQYPCMTRWLDPAQYDWPLTHWSKEEYPWLDAEKEIMPMFIRASRPLDIALGWRQGFQSYRASEAGAFLTAENYTKVMECNYVGRTPLERVEVTTTTDDSTSAAPIHRVLPGALAILAGGSAPEGVSVGRFSSFRFWDEDRYANISPPGAGIPVQGLRTISSSQRVLISGAGDGALQDFLRIVTNHTSARSIYMALSEQMPQAVGKAWSRVETSLLNAEDQSQRAFFWGTSRRPPVISSPQVLYDHAVLGSLHHAHQEALGFLKIEGVWPHICRSLSKIVKHTPFVTLVHPCGHFGQCYPLNHFLVLLITEYLRGRGDGQVRLLPFQKLASIMTANPSTHTCSNEPGDCFGEPHIVTMQVCACDGENADRISTSFDASDATLTFDVIVLRHGPHRNQNPTPGSAPDELGLVPIPLPRQLLPYHLPIYTP